MTLTSRISTTQRRDEIVAATLHLLARRSLDALTTRELAAELGLSQPALFKHFRSRDALLLAVVDHARAALEAVAVAIVEGGHPAVAQLAALGRALLVHAEREPGLPRLLFASTTQTGGEVREALRHVVAMQAALAAELVREGQRQGDLDGAVDPESAATLFVGMLQGLILRWEIGDHREGLAARFDPLFALWLRGVAASRDEVTLTDLRPAGGRPEPGPREAAPPGARTSPLRVVDVRPMIARGVDPLATILEALDVLPPSGVLVIEAPFRPSPLLSLLAQRGHLVTVEAAGDRHWVVEVVVGGAPAIDDLRDLEPPLPLERVLAASAALRPGAIYLARLPRFPRMLLPHLRERGLRFDIVTRSDGAALVRVEKGT